MLLKYCCVSTPDASVRQSGKAGGHAGRLSRDPLEILWRWRRRACLSRASGDGRVEHGRDLVRARVRGYGSGVRARAKVRVRVRVRFRRP